ncbi:MAG: queuosine precursor transporter [Patescibacteria group bacterium]|nr:queuosine precursor transporter [Patescibacteria group bacterium]
MLKRLGVAKMDLLLAIYIFCILSSETMGSKTFPVADLGFMQLNASVAIFLFPLVYLINDIVYEVHGRERVRSMVRSSWVIVFLLFLFTLLATALPPSTRFAGSESAYDLIFGKSARFAAASLIALAVADLLDIFVFSKLRERLGKKALWFRSGTSNVLSQFVDTIVFMTLAFWALDRSVVDNVTFLTGLILPYWGVKSAMSLIQTPLVYAGVRWLKG